MPLGLDSGTVRVVPYDPEWPELFRAEAARLQAAIAPALSLVIEHTGSTAVPGLAAKPVLDMLAGCRHGASVDAYVVALTKVGFEHRGEQGIPGRRFFRRGNPRAYHLHLTEQGSVFWREQLAFRDALIADAALRDAYAWLKVDLARRFPRDRESYTSGKTAFVQQVLGPAQPAP